MDNENDSMRAWGEWNTVSQPRSIKSGLCVIITLLNWSWSRLMCYWKLLKLSPYNCCLLRGSAALRWLRLQGCRSRRRGRNKLERLLLFTQVWSRYFDTMLRCIQGSCSGLKGQFSSLEMDPIVILCGLLWRNVTDDCIVSKSMLT